MLPKYQRFEMCSLNDNETEEERGFRIDQECFAAKQLCNIRWIPDNILKSQEKFMGWIYHPQHLALCQNLTFWKAQRRNLRKYINCSQFKKK
jgi:hypothetical protein